MASRGMASRGIHTQQRCDYDYHFNTCCVVLLKLFVRLFAGGQRADSVVALFRANGKNTR